MSNNTRRSDKYLYIDLRMWMFIFFYILCSGSLSKGNEFLGCYKNVPYNNNTELLPKQFDVANCNKQCKERYYRYSLIQENGECVCGNFLGEEVNNTQNCTSDCTDNCSNIYATGNLVSSAPQNMEVANITETSIKISWMQPKSYVTITSYTINVKILHTYSSNVPPSPEWVFTNDTFNTKLITLQPATRYNVSLGTISPEGNGATVNKIIETLLAEPDNAPHEPNIIKNDGTTMMIQITPVTNNNGPITSYRVVVINQDEQESFQIENVMPYDEAKKYSLTYYISAELDPNQIKSPFVVGDGKIYGGYKNVPLDPNINYIVILGLVSTLNGVTKVRYTEPTEDVLFLNSNGGKDSLNSNGDNPGLIIGLSIAIALLSCLLVAGIIGFIILKSRVTNRRQRLSDNQELTLQGPMIEVENNGYIPEEEHEQINHYKSLKEKLLTFNMNQIKIETTNLLGTGKFGRVNSGTLIVKLNDTSTVIPIAAYSIHDKKMNQETKKSMLQELDLLIKCGKHDNIVSLFGTCETSQLVIVALEYITMNLKDLLLGSRDSIAGKFSNMNESQALDIAIQISKGMAHLESCKIVHKQLCARSVLISNGFQVKISGFGLAHYYSHNKIPDYTRWTAVEIFKGQTHTYKSDVWSFACLLWEICVLGGTPYGNLSNTNEIPQKIINGLRLPQLSYLRDDFYQIMLDCWQLNLDERPNFRNLTHLLLSLNDNQFIPYLNFSIYSNFQYEQFYPDMELALRPVL